MLEPLVHALHARRPAADHLPIGETRQAVAALHQAVALDPMYGSAFRRSAGIAVDDSDPGPTTRWWADALARCLDLEPTAGSTRPEAEPAAAPREEGAPPCP